MVIVQKLVAAKIGGGGLDMTILDSINYMHKMKLTPI